MASPLNNFDFPYFPRPPPPAVKPPSHSIPPPSPHTFTPPPPYIIPQPPHTFTPPPPPPPHIIPPPPHTFTPPPPHIIPPPPPSSPDNHSTVIVIVFVSFGGLFFLAFLAIALCFYIKKKKKMVQETDTVHVDEHLKVTEVIVPGPHGSQTVVLSIEDDVHIEEEIRKNEKFGGSMHVKSADNIHSAVEEGTSTSGSTSSHHHLEHKH